MKRLVLGGVSAAVLCALASFGLEAPAPPAQPTPLSYHGLPLSRAFRHQFTLTAPMVIQMPPSAGAAITQVTLIGQSVDLAIDVNGASERFTVAGPAIHHTHAPNPPVIARPGDVVTISALFYPQQVSLGGSTILPGET